jgi:hypothetical protein
MTTVSYEPKQGMIRANLAPETWSVEVHSGPEGRAVTIRLTRLEASRLIEQLADAIHHASRAEQLRSGGVTLGVL